MRTELSHLQTLVVHDSKYGNTKKLAEIVAEAMAPHGRFRVLDLEEVLPADLGSVDLLIVGGPTQLHGLSPRMRQFTDELALLPGAATMAATFDTRYRMPGTMSGSAARQIARRLKRKGFQIVATPESFFVTRHQPPELEAGELERAAGWARHLANRCALSRWCAA